MSDSHKNWKYYNHGLLPTTAPHEEADIKAMKQKGFWKNWGVSSFSKMDRKL